MKKYFTIGAGLYNQEVRNADEAAYIKEDLIQGILEPVLTALEAITAVDDASRGRKNNKNVLL